MVQLLSPVTPLPANLNAKADLAKVETTLRDDFQRYFRSAGVVQQMRSRRPWSFSHPTTAVTSQERNCL
jgi:hypothetical protein